MSGIRLAPWAALTRTTAGAVLRSDLAALHLGGPDAAAFVEQALPLLDGTRDLAALQAALPGYSPASVEGLIRALAARGLLVDGDPREAMIAAFLRVFPGDPGVMRARLAEARVVGAGEGRWLQSALRALESAGLGEVERVGEEGLEIALQRRPCALLIAAVSPGDTVALERISRAAQRAGVCSLWARWEGARAILGPVVTPGETACRVCAQSELNGIEPPKESPLRRRGMARRGERALGPMVALAAVGIVGGAPSPLGGRVLIQDRASWTTSIRTLVRVPWCRVCGSIEGRGSGTAGAGRSS